MTTAASDYNARRTAERANRKVIDPADIVGFTVRAIPKVKKVAVKLGDVITAVGRFKVFGVALRAVADGVISIEEFDMMVDAASADVKRMARERIATRNAKTETETKG